MATPMGEAKPGPLPLEFDRRICFATRDRKWSSGESRIRPLLLSVLAAIGPLHRHAPARYCRREPKWLF